MLGLLGVVVKKRTADLVHMVMGLASLRSGAGSNPEIDIWKVIDVGVTGSPI
jgi:hypothetical protein